VVKVAHSKDNYHAMKKSSLQFAVITLSDRCSRGDREDLSGPLIVKTLTMNLSAHCTHQILIPDNPEQLSHHLVTLSDDQRCDLILTTGGTGLAPTDITPETTKIIIDKEIPGIAEAIRHKGLAITPHSMLSRGISGQRKHTLIINLSGSPKAVTEQLEVIIPILPHAIETIRGDATDCAR
jgi:molybdopterin adenylyltransferase